VTEVGQVPVAIGEIVYLSGSVRRDEPETYDLQSQLAAVHRLAVSIQVVTCANPGCLSQMAENMEVKS